VRIGAPHSWNTVKMWLNPNTTVHFPSQLPLPTYTKKCPDIPRLPTYTLPPTGEFWKQFPSAKLPSFPSSAINFSRLREIITYCRHRLDINQTKRAEKVISDLHTGSAVPFTCRLPPIRVNNTPSVIDHGEEFTDTLGWWIKQGMYQISQYKC
jgi:hypothetical protein